MRKRFKGTGTGSPKPEGSTYVCKTWGYVMEKHEGKWVRQHRLRMEKKLGRKLVRGEVVHHKDEDRTNNEDDNLVLMDDPSHKSLHSSVKGRHTEETKEKMRVAAIEVANREGERERRSERAKTQNWRS